MRILYQSYVDYEHGKVYWDKLRSFLEASVLPDTDITIEGITPHDSFAHALVEMRCAREMICNVIQAERDGYDAVIVGHFQDAGLYEARSTVDIPVIGLGESSMLYCCQLAQRIGIVTINPRFTPWFRHQIRKYGLQSRVTSVHAMTFEPGEIIATMATDAESRSVREKFMEQAKPMVEEGVELLLPGGGIPMLMFADQPGAEVDGAPIVNGIEIAVKTAEMAVSMKRSGGYGVSRAGEFSKPPPEILEEFLLYPKNS